MVEQWLDALSHLRSQTVESNDDIEFCIYYKTKLISILPIVLVEKFLNRRSTPLFKVDLPSLKCPDNNHVAPSALNT
ncbi:hypothetical protein T10_13359 [Trichinella papuae]|uniref:Uncharacterized protein n=1 Tax=Trichinella papuae TaxID=268474 RepID=A0A0V1M621_9BILA|nr:hypothetical protein T10_13359 [Trichinella papuae]